MAFHLNLSPRVRKILRYAGIVVFALIVFIEALQLSFPYNRIKDKVVEQLADKYDIQIGEVERGIVPGRVYFNDVNIRTRQTKPDDIVTTMLIKRLEVDVGILPLLGKTLRVDIEAKIGTGTLQARVALKGWGKDGFKVSATGDNLPGTGLPMRAIVGLPVSGKINFSASLDLPNDHPKAGKPTPNWPKAEGAFALACPSGCTVGDGKTKLKPLIKNASQQAMVGEGIDFGKVDIDSLVARAEIKNGKLDVTKFDVQSKDGEVHVDYSMTLDKDFGNSVVAGCLRFKGSKLLEQKEPKTFAALQTTGAELRSDGLFHIRLTDRFSMMKRLNMECGPNVKNATNGENFGGTPGAAAPPRLTVMPDQKPTVPPIQTPPVNEAPPPPPVAPPPGGAIAPASGQPGSGRPPGPEGEGPVRGSGSADGAVPPGEKEPPPAPATPTAGPPPSEPSRRN
ncbi:MAG: type II secretion system protein GspN [Deltaproteobacteria bacterium]|nr:type II secretion system protein GspN [Deltaproteobacteria bacterium]